MSFFTRRRFLGAVISSIGVFLGLKRLTASSISSPQAPPSHPLTIPRPAPRVVISRNPAVFEQNSALNPAILERMLDNAMSSLAGKDPGEVWSDIFRPDDVIGIKLNCLAGRGLSPHPELVRLIVKKLVTAGVNMNNIIAWDRTDRDLKRAGFSIRRRGNGFRCFGTNDDYDTDKLEFMGSMGSIFSPILAKTASAIISVPVMKDHDLAGVTLSMKNFYGSIHNPNKYHDNNCSPYVAELNSHPFIKNKVRLVITDALVAQYHGGPSYKPQFCWDYAGLIVARDQVAHDRIGWKIIEDRRKEMGLPGLKESKREPQYIGVAGELGLGESDIERIEVLEV